MSIEIIGISVVKNEDIYLSQAIKNIINFCDKIIIVDNNSSDETVAIAKKYVSQYPDKISLRLVDKISDLQSIVTPFVGENKWIFGVDGDELYDPNGLHKLRSRILEGGYQNYWMLRGYFFHLIKINLKSQIGVGYLAPPSKDPNKLYNFKLLKSWDGDGKQTIFHPYTHVFKNEKYNTFHLPKRKFLFKKSKWEDCMLRCVHTRLLKRSSKEDYEGDINYRLNMTDVVKDRDTNYREKYRIGNKKEKDISAFLDES